MARCDFKYCPDCGAQLESEIMTTPSWADSPIHEQIRASGLDHITERAALCPSDATTFSLPPYDEWRKLPFDEAARILAKARGLDAEQEGLIAAILEHFREENV